MKPSKNVYKRSRPLLGTFVEISLWGAPTKTLEKCGEKTFDAIEKISSLMSFHDPKSELSRMNRLAVGKWMKISQHTKNVLKFALELQTLTHGQFNVAIAKPLMAWGFLPENSKYKEKSKFNHWHHLDHPGFELKGLNVRIILPVKIDLGGIAKGYAVDFATEILKKHVSKRVSRSICGCINSGGDLRVFGNEELCIGIRSGKSTLHLTQLKNQSLATSSIILKTKQSPYIDIQKRKSLASLMTAVVRADHCMTADALTKVALLSPPAQAEKVALKYRAEMSLIPQ